MGLIYLFEFQDIEKANQFIKQSKLGEYPFGQKNYGLLNQFYLNNIEEAKYMYQRASKNKFALSEYNQGYILENEGKIEESIQFYIRAIELKDEPLIFKNKQHYDKRLDISKKFVICFTNLKLVDYYLSKSNYNEAKNYFNKAFTEIISNDDSYKFQFQFHKNYLFAYVKLFIFKCPLFNSLEPNFDLPINSISTNRISILMNNKEKEYLTNCMKRNINEMNVLDTLKFTNAGDLFDFVINEKEVKKLFMKEIKDIILLMNNILYTEPYNILFGRINMKRKKKSTNNNPNSYAKDINELFYEGFGFSI